MKWRGEKKLVCVTALVDSGHDDNPRLLSHGQLEEFQKLGTSQIFDIFLDILTIFYFSELKLLVLKLELQISFHLIFSY